MDLIVTGDSAVIDRLSRALLRVLSLHGLRFSDVFAVPLTMSSVIRQMLLERQDADPVPHENVGDAIDQVEVGAHRAAGRFLDALQDHLDSLVKKHNAYLKTVSDQLKTDIVPLQIERPAYYRSKS